MKVLVKSWKNATEQHDYGSKTNENACIKFEFSFFSWNLYYIIHYTSVCSEMNINDVLCTKFVAWQLCPVSTVPTARQIARHEGCLKKKLTTKILSLLAFEAEDVRGAMFCKCIIDRQN